MQVRVHGAPKPSAVTAETERQRRRERRLMPSAWAALGVGGDWDRTAPTAAAAATAAAGAALLGVCLAYRPRLCRTSPGDGFHVFGYRVFMRIAGPDVPCVSFLHHDVTFPESLCTVCAWIIAAMELDMRPVTLQEPKMRVVTAESTHTYTRYQSVLAVCMRGLLAYPSDPCAFS